MLKVAIIGTGGIATRHAEALAEVADAELAGCWSRSEDNRARFAARFGCKVFPTIDDLFGDAAVDAVLVLSNADTHVEYALRGLRAGKHVLVEKPVGQSVDDIRRHRDEARKFDRVCMPSHNYIYAPETRRLRHHAAAGNTSLYFAGKPDRLVSVASNVRFPDPQAEDQIGITCVYADGRIANLWASWATEDLSRDPWSVTMKVFGEHGSGISSWDNVKNDNQPSPAWDDGAYWDSFYNVQKFFLEEAIGKRRPPLSTLDDAVDAALLLEAATTSLAEQRWVQVKN